MIKPKTCGCCTYCYDETFDRGVCASKLDTSLLTSLRESLEENVWDSQEITDFVCSIVSRARVDMDMCPECNTCPCLERFDSWKKLKRDIEDFPSLTADDIVRRARALAKADEEVEE